ncbi:WAT1-related protein At4g15540-like [Jatropha curcas]|uniref:WAT1-related protein At4g15540-like n=1 Tax=Jatropha curcas TaxID=180498 RepID=UPI00189473AB|nr:WAT1-related protein At4g15540-like [Jatropha curcas]
MGSRFLYEDLLPLMAMVSVECTNVGLNTLFKAASLTGMSYFVFIAYYYAIATLVLTFIQSSLFDRDEMENVNMRRSRTQAKLIGTIVSISVASVVVFYESSTIFSTSSPTNSISFHWPLASAQSDWLIGGLLLAIGYLLYALWCIPSLCTLADILKICPTELVVTYLYALCATIISAPVCFLAEQILDAWLLKYDIAVVAVFYSGIFGPCYSAIIHAWGLRRKGPVYITIFKPLSIAISAFAGVIFLWDPLHLGTVVGALVISIGFYAVIGGKANEEIPSEKVTFLQIDDM